MKKKQTKRKQHGNAKQIAIVVIVLFLIAAIAAALLWISDLGTNWSVKTWGDKFNSDHQQVTTPDNGGNKPVIPTIPEPILYNEINIGDEITSVYFDPTYEITDEDIMRFKREGKAVEDQGITQYYLVYYYHGGYSSPLGIYYYELSAAFVKDMLSAENIEYQSDEISDDFMYQILLISPYDVNKFDTGIVWCQQKGYISTRLLDLLMGEDTLTFGYTENTHHENLYPHIEVEEVYCVDILRRFVQCEVKKPTPIIDPILYDEVKVGYELNTVGFNTLYAITDEDIERFKSEGKLIDTTGIKHYYLIYTGKGTETYHYGLALVEITGADIKAALASRDIQIQDNEISDDAVIYMLRMTPAADDDAEIVWSQQKGYISPRLLNLYFGKQWTFGYKHVTYYFNSYFLDIEEVHCADIMRKFLYCTYKDYVSC